MAKVPNALGCPYHCLGIVSQIMHGIANESLILQTYKTLKWILSITPFKMSYTSVLTLKRVGSLSYTGHVTEEYDSNSTNIRVSEALIHITYYRDSNING